MHALAGEARPAESATRIGSSFTWCVSDGLQVHNGRPLKLPIRVEACAANFPRLAHSYLDAISNLCAAILNKSSELFHQMT